MHLNSKNIFRATKMPHLICVFTSPSPVRCTSQNSLMLVQSGTPFDALWLLCVVAGIALRGRTDPVLENWVLRRMFAHNREQVTEGSRVKRSFIICILPKICLFHSTENFVCITYMNSFLSKWYKRTTKISVGGCNNNNYYTI